MQESSAMSDGKRRRELARADRVLPGVWRLRLPLPWPAVPHVNAYAIAAGTGVVLIDTGMHEPGSLAQLERALDQAGLRLDHIRLVVCTHAHSDHYGLAGPIVDASGCELWMHPNHAHMTRPAEDPERAFERRIEVARHSGVPLAALERYRDQNKDRGVGIARVVAPDRDLLPGVEIETDLGRWQVHETPGHAPSHVVLHQPERRLLLSGDHVLGRASLYFDYGYTPDPVDEYLSSLDKVRDLDVDLILAGHGRPVRDLPRLVGAHEDLVEQALARVRIALADGPQTPFEIVAEVLGITDVPPAAMSWGLSLTLCYLRHLELQGQVERVDGSDPEQWRLV
jgi:glyoxylase-like metal-dependent hydrolase (beta-lactamase superfamily II)